MTDITQELRDPEHYYPGNFDTPERAVAFLTGLCQDAAVEIEVLRSKVSYLQNALHLISLGSQNSASSKDECGKIAREALDNTKGDYQ